MTEEIRNHFDDSATSKCFSSRSRVTSSPREEPRAFDSRRRYVNALTPIIGGGTDGSNMGGYPPMLGGGGRKFLLM